MARPVYENVDYYDCTGKANGNYIHPADCTRFITCTDGQAADMPCPLCGLDENPSQCAGSEYLFWDQTRDRCEWPDTTTCGTDESAGTGTPVAVSDPAPDTTSDDPSDTASGDGS
jgi:hypothetical protein